MNIKAVEREINATIDALYKQGRHCEASFLSSDLFACSCYADLLMVRDDAKRIISIPSF